MPGPVVKTSGWLVQIDLARLARMLTAELQKPMTPAGAAMWLTRGKPMENDGKGKPCLLASPFAFTSVEGTFYCESDPKLLLHPRHVMRLLEIPARRRRDNGDLICPIVEW